PKLALKRAGGKPELRDRMLRLFVEHHQDDAANLRAALEAGDWDRIRQLAHALKGSSGAIGYPDLEAATGRLEAVGRDTEDAASAAALIDKIERALSGLRVPVPDGAMSESRPPAEAADIASLVRELRQALSESDTRARGIMEQLEQAMHDPPPMLATIQRHVSAYAFEQAEQELDSLVKALGMQA
ncbi:Hpt domain-containing protein, partial [uncultured Abyssibacter sp.]|uniref:Hpt domain-containing protein n=1 Tax=uncultured Abyssibacter sp. TaxID=2320202 RepID=UPI0032B22E5B